jgi:hypothetical protein
VVGIEARHRAAQNTLAVVDVYEVHLPLDGARQEHNALG